MDFYLFTFYFYLSSSFPDSHTVSSEMGPETETRRREEGTGESVDLEQLDKPTARINRSKMELAHISHHLIRNKRQGAKEVESRPKSEGPKVRKSKIT